MLQQSRQACASESCSRQRGKPSFTNNCSHSHRCSWLSFKGRGFNLNMLIRSIIGGYNVLRANTSTEALWHQRQFR